MGTGLGRREKYSVAFENGRLSYSDYPVDLKSVMNVLLGESARRGHGLYFFSADDVFSMGGAPYARMSLLGLDGSRSVRDAEYTDVIKTGEEDIPLPEMDICFIGAEDIKPSTPNIELIEQAEDDVVFLVGMKGNLDTCDKYELIRRCPDVPSPVTYKADSPEEAMDAIGRLPDNDGYFVLKDRYGIGYGEEVHRLRYDDPGMESRVREYLGEYGHAVVQEFCPGIRNGDVRIMFLDGESLPAFKRVAPRGEWRTNAQHGSRILRHSATPGQLEIARRVAESFPEARFSAVDMLESGEVFEINAMPGVRRLPELYDEYAHMGGVIMDLMEGETRDIKRQTGIIIHEGLHP